MLELLSERGMSQSDLGRELRLSNSYISDVCKGRRGMSAQLAVRLENIPAFPPAEFWVALQTNRDVAIARRTVKP